MQEGEVVDNIIEDILKHEGGYVDHVHDKGGKTNYGITETVARKNGFKGDMRELPLFLAKQIYEKDYFYKINLDKVLKHSFILAWKLTHISVNMGQGRACRFLQEGLNSFQKQQIKVDSQIGDKTIESLRVFLSKSNRNEMLLLSVIQTLQANLYIRIVKKNPSQRVFLRGWIGRTFDIEPAKSYLRRIDNHRLLI